jgi:hypothetical protein
MGQRADVWIEVARRVNVVRIPLSFLRRDEAGPYCYVDRGGRVGIARLVLGTQGTELAEVRDGLAAGEVVLDALTPGATLAEGRRWEKSAR